MKTYEYGELVSLIDDEEENSFENDYNDLEDFQCDDDFAYFTDKMF